MRIGLDERRARFPSTWNVLAGDLEYNKTPPHFGVQKWNGTTAWVDETFTDEIAVAVPSYSTASPGPGGTSSHHGRDANQRAIRIRRALEAD